MDRDDYTDESYTAPHVPPATPPVIDAHATAFDAAALANDNGDSDYPGTFAGEDEDDDGDDDIAPGESPDEIVPDEPAEIVPDDGDLIEPSRPDEIEIEREDGGAIDEPGRTPQETPLPPD